MRNNGASQLLCSQHAGQTGRCKQSPLAHTRNACLGLVQLTTYAYWGTRSLTSLQSNHVMQQTNTGVLSS